MDDLEWQQDANCAGFDTDLWYPRHAPYSFVKELCRLCPVKRACLEYALTNELPSRRYGIWGGLSPEQRGALVNV